MKELESKIRDVFPHLKELRDGAVIYKPHWNIFSQKYEDGVFDENLMCFHHDLRVGYWDLSSVYLSDQKEDLINF